MNKFLKWLFKSKRRSYKFEYLAIGFMGNRYSVGVYCFEVSDSFLNEHNYNHPSQYGFTVHKELGKHFKSINGYTKYASIDRIKHPN